MPKPRIIDQSFWEDLDIVRLSRDERLLLIALITAGADDTGRTKANPVFVKRLAFAFDDDIGIDEIVTMLRHLHEHCRNVLFYEDHGELYAWFRNWQAYQQIKYVRNSKLPDPPQEQQALSIFGQDAPKLDDHDQSWVQGRVGLGREELGRVGLDGVGSGGVGAEEPDDDDRTAPMASKPISTAWHNATGRTLSLTLLQEFGVEEQLLEGEAGHSGAEWVSEAIAEGAKSSKGPLTVNYVTSILRRWQRDGFRAPYPSGQARASPGNGEPVWSQALDEWVSEQENGHDPNRDA